MNARELHQQLGKLIAMFGHADAPVVFEQADGTEIIIDELNLTTGRGELSGVYIASIRAKPDGITLDLCERVSQQMLRLDAQVKDNAESARENIEALYYRAS